MESVALCAHCSSSHGSVRVGLREPVFEERREQGMTALEQLNAYLRRLQLRARLFAASRGAGVVAGSALLLTVVFVWIANRFEFAEDVVLPLRIL
jgi:hypothetical protein